MATMPVAGVTTKFTQDTTEACLHLDQRPGTPPGIRKWRKSYYDEPGRRVLHPGMIDDFAGRDHSHPKFGKIVKGESDHVADVVYGQRGTESEFALVKEMQREASYMSVKREPLGKSYQRGHALPEECSFEDFAFGRKNESAEDQSKNLIYAPTEMPTEGMRTQYRTSHGTVDPGEQKRRAYDWKNVDVETHRFGAGAGSHVALNGMALGAVGALKQQPEDDDDVTHSTRLQNYRNLQDKLGRSRNLGHEAQHPDHLYGKSSIRGDGDWDARNCIQGAEDQDAEEPDRDLGTTLTPGFRNVNEATAADRVFGCPSVRSDIQKYARRSIADCQNYGDDANARALLYPTTMLNLGMDDEELERPRSKAEIVDLFTVIGTDLSKQQLEELYDTAASGPRGTVSLHDFRKLTLGVALDQFKSG